VNFLADENIAQPIVERLRQENHQVWYIAEIAPNISDDKVLKFANDEKAILLTSDKDFGELVFRQQRGHLGIILIRLAGLSMGKKIEIVLSTINNYLPELPDSFTVISSGGIRLRRANM